MSMLKRFFGVKKESKDYDSLVAMSPQEYREQEDKENKAVHEELDSRMSSETCDYRCGDFRCYKGQIVVPPYLDEPVGECNDCHGTGLKVKKDAK